MNSALMVSPLHRMQHGFSAKKKTWTGPIIEIRSSIFFITYLAKVFLFRRRLKTFNSFSNNAIVVLTKSVLNGGFFRLNNLSSSSRALFLLVAMTLMCLQLLLGIGVTVLLVLDCNYFKYQSHILCRGVVQGLKGSRSAFRKDDGFSKKKKITS